MSEEQDELQALQEVLGPKRVETKEIEIEGHDPMVLQRLVERRKSKPYLFSDFAMTQVEPADDTCPNKEIDGDTGS